MADFWPIWSQSEEKEPSYEEAKANDRSWLSCPSPLYSIPSGTWNLRATSVQFFHSTL